MNNLSQFFYIGIHREALDKIQQLKNELWKIISYSKSGYSEMIAVVKEVTSFSKDKMSVTKRLFIYYKQYYYSAYLMIHYLIN